MMKRSMCWVMVLMLTLSLFAGCTGNDEASDAASDSDGTKGSVSEVENDGSSDVDDSVSEEESVYIELWDANAGFLPIEKDGALYNLYKELSGVGVIEPYIEWDGGTNYLNHLNMRIAAGDMPDIFIPYNGNEIELAQNGAIVDLTDLLPEYAPNVWNNIPSDVWEVVKASDPTGEGRIYWVPQVVTYARTAGMIRQDWLDTLGLDVPKTQEDFVKVLEAFKTSDPNGNGLADELPTGGRAEARWMDHLFLMYGVALDEGYPDWDLYNGELTYSAVTQNMKDALAFCADLYQKGLIDPESLLNDKTAWDSKVFADRVGVYFHWAEHNKIYTENAFAGTGVKQEWTILPAIEVDGYEGQSFYPVKAYKSAQWVIADNKDESKLMATLKFLDSMYNPALLEYFYYGAEGMHHEVVDGEKVLMPTDMGAQENLIGVWTPNASLDSTVQLMKLAINDDNAWSYEQSIECVTDAQAYAKSVASAGMPASIYGMNDDIRNRTLYKEYASNIIVGEYDIDKFDEFVELWYANGGTEVTENARAWYASIAK